MSDPFDEINVPARKIVKKGWGHEVFVYHRVGDYLPHFYVDTVKILKFDKGKHCSSHFHVDKEELFYIIRGKIELELIKDAIKRRIILYEEDSVLIRPGMVHQMWGLDDVNLLLEVSTLDKPEDSYRIKRGD